MIMLTSRYLINFDLKDVPTYHFDTVIIGSGVAGLSCASHLSKSQNIALVTKTELSHTATRYAQGGIAAAIGPEDSPKSHYEDTIETGRGLCDPEAVKILVEEGPECIDELVKLGVSFDQVEGNLSLGLEAGHSRPRVIHAKDFTGSEVEASLVKAVKSLDNIHIHEKVFVVDILTDDDVCKGVLVMEDNNLAAFIAPVVVLAAGGMGQLFSITTNPPISTGDGLVMAYRAGAALKDTEFIQFHPTTLHMDMSPRFLISEAVRGEGAYIRDGNGTRFLVDAYPEAELAPRDEVVRQMFLTMRELDTDHVFLDCTHLGKDVFESRFPVIYEKLLENSIDMKNDLIPISPAAHYMSGGVQTDYSGTTNIAGLFACGEVACTGVHGANRLASNSLLEGLVFSKRVANAALGYRKNDVKKGKSKIDIKFDRKGEKSTIDAEYEKEKLGEAMIRRNGVLRSEEGLSVIFRFLEERMDVFNMDFNSPVGLELLNLLTLAKIVNSVSLRRKESRGSHWREDYPYEDDDKWLKHLVVTRDQDEMIVEVGR